MGTTLNTYLLIVIIIIIILFFLLIGIVIVSIDVTIFGVAKKVDNFVRSNLIVNAKDKFNIFYQQSSIPTGFNSQITDFDNNLAIFLARCQLSSIIYGSLTLQGLTPTEDDLQLPPELSIAGRVGNRAVLLKRQGTNFYILANRGTLTSTDILNDVAALQTQLLDLDGEIVNGALVQSGFYDDWRLLNKEYNQIWNIIPAGSQLIVIGHSEGVAHAQFTALSYFRKPNKQVDLALYIFAPPRVGNNLFTEQIKTNIPNNWSVVNQTDFIPDLPPSSFVINVDNYLYDELENQVQLNIQLGSLSNNHYMDSYLCGLFSGAEECKDISEHIVWQYSAQKLSPFLL